MADVPSRLRAALSELAEDGPVPSRAWCVRWTEELDAGLRELWAAASLPGRIAVVAQAGYGRRELCPGSDVDLLLLTDHRSTQVLEAAVRALIYPLWDAGLVVGHAVRDRRQAVSLAVDDPEIATALLDARTVAGDPDLVVDVRRRLIDRLRRRPARFLAALADRDRDRRLAAGDTAEVLEPDLKHGAGGLRDVQSLRWAAAALLGDPSLDALVAAGYLGAPDRAALARAYDLLLAVRVALHLVAEQPTDVLRLDLQERVAARLGLADADALMHQVFLAARTIDHIHRRAWTLLRADAARGRRRRRPADAVVDGIVLSDGVARIDDPAELRRPDLATRLLVVLAGHRAVLDRRTAAALRDRAPTPTWQPADRERFLRVLWAGSAALDALEELDDAGLLVAMLPEWAPVRARPQRNPFHRFSVDRHLLHTAVGLADLVRDQQWAAETLEEVEDRDALMLGALLHDIGKGYGEPHSLTGVEVARRVAQRVGLGAASEELVARMVRLHLLLPDVATRRDPTDPGLVQAVAAEVGDRQTLAALHLLAAADGLATGPSAWTPWKATLIEQLVTKVRTVFDDAARDVIAEDAVRTAHRAVELAPGMGVDPETVRAHLALLPSRYAAAVDARTAVRHAAMASSPLAPTEVRTRVTPGPEGYDALDVVAVDRPGLFAKVAGVLALHGGSVLSAHAYTRRDGIAVDTFTVQRPAEAGGAWWAAVEGDIVEAVAGRLALRARVARRSHTYRRRYRRQPPVPTRVEVSADQAGEATVVEVHTADRIGVLYRIAAALAELELDIVVAKISTIGHEVVDVFYVRDLDGRPLDEEHAREVVLAVEAALADER